MTMDCTIGKYPAALILYFLCIGLWYPILVSSELSSDVVIEKGELGETANVTCEVIPENATIEWLFKGEPLTNHERINITDRRKELKRKDPDGNFKHSHINTIMITNVSAEDTGNYTCIAKLGDDSVNKTKMLNMSFETRLLNVTQSPIRVNFTDSRNVTMVCVFEAFMPGEIKWWKKGKTIDENIPLNKNNSKLERMNAKQIRSTYSFTVKSVDDTGSYECVIEDKLFEKNVTGTIELHVITRPIVIIDKAIPVNTTQVYLNWTVQAFNSPIESYVIMNSIDGVNFIQHTVDKIDKNSTNFLVNGLNASTAYRLKLEVKTEFGQSQNPSFVNVTTLSKEPIFVPNISINGFSATSVTIGWAPPPAEIADLIHYYELTAKKKGDNQSTFKSCQSRDSNNLPYMFDNLQPHTTYVFQVQACSEFTKTCGPMSEEMEAATLDGVPGKPSNISTSCSVDYLNLTWSTPINPNAEIKGYTVEITGNAVFKDRKGQERKATWGPLSKFTTNASTSVRVNDLAPNTVYTVRVSAMTRTRRRGDEAVDNCTTKTTVPDVPPKPRWRKILQNDTYMFKMFMPRISERNGPICCYRIYMVRLPPHIDWKNVPNPNGIPVFDYETVHKNGNILGAYITDIFSNNNFPSDSELVLGDNLTIFNKSDPILNSADCRRCLKRPNRIKHEPPIPPVVSTSGPADDSNDGSLTVDGDDNDNIIFNPDEPQLPPNRRRRSSDGDYSKNPTMMDKETDDRDDVKVSDGRLESSATYILFVELITGMEAEQSILFSDYTTPLMPAPSPAVSAPSSAVEIALQATCGIAGLVLLVMIAFCVVQTRRSRKVPPHAHHELNPITAAMRYWDSIRGHRPLVSQIPPEIPPIPKEDLVHAYTQRQMDSDYGFQKEFELLQMLPECFPDRTTHASEARENQPKNRYPDIKAYDQTRVKLSQIDSINGSDYINANFVMGYQDRKRFICAQGPTDTTVNDFWRMIWEHGLELIVMLTNLEEYSKVKCSKYWPEERSGRAFGNITVHHVGEKRYSDYIVRELRISKQPTNADGQPIIENNGISKRNGEVKEGSDSSVPTSPREIKECGESRIVRQYHFLMWKDFAAPEHPHSILKFIKRVNEAWSNMVGRPVVVHCSAGVGRTGTLVALDCLLEQMRETGHVSIFNTVAELRRQRNFLVQSLKQYVFVYRALVEYAHLGDTEINASRLKQAVDRLRNTPEGADKCLMEYEFEKMLVSPVAEPLKSTGAGAGEELRTRNRSVEFLPYDRNRVILTPITGRDYSTYINASFIEAYDNSESFIITQDPLPNTIMDFWRMVSEHNVTNIVMLSELGEGKCPRYWDDGTVSYEHISVEYEESESCPYYTRRQFRVTNEKSGSTSLVRQLQYQGWPTARGHVPEVTRGLAELADAAGAHQPPEPPNTMLVHCQFGTERSPLFVALCTLIRQLRVERRIDVSGVARAVRSQRARTIDTFLQYEFLYRAILNYAELHNLLEDS